MTDIQISVQEQPFDQNAVYQWETMVRFSPSIRMTSAMVPMAARVQYRANRAFSRSGYASKRGVPSG